MFLVFELGPYLVPHQNLKIFKIFCHIESLDTYIEH